MAEQSVAVRITRKRYRALKQEAEKNGHTLSWLLNLCVDLYFQGSERTPSKPTIAAVEEGRQA